MHVTMNFEQARFNMVEQQIRSSEPLREDVRELLHLVRREEFVPAAYRHLAFADVELPLGHGAAMLTPRIEAAAVQALKPRKQENVLEIGTGSGYMAALLAVHANHVTSVEIVPELADTARANLHRAGLGNVTVETGDGLAVSAAASDHFDVIMLSGGLGNIPAALLARLKVGGRLLAFVGEAPVQTARLVTCVDEGAYRGQGLFETCIAQLRNAPTGTEFTL
jgi:protein-L-isoaspartate(D-aspartate) O-methyltransferase